MVYHALTYDTNQVAVVTMDKYLIIKKTEKDSGHNEHHEKVNKCQTRAEKDTY
jgi:hypothetical protein